MGNAKITNPPLINKNEALEVTNPIHFVIDDIVIKSDTEAKARQYSLLLGYQKKNLRYGIEISNHDHEIDVEGSSNTQVPIDPMAATTLEVLFGMPATSDSTPISPTFVTVNNNMQITMLLGKVFYDYHLSKSFVGYAGVGVGITRAKFNSVTKAQINIVSSLFGDSIPSFILDPILANFPELNVAEKISESKITQYLPTGQFITGISLQLDKNIAIFIEYNLTQTTKIKAPLSQTVTVHAVLAGFNLKLF